MVYKKIVLVGTSNQNFQDAVENALVEASKTVRNIVWYQVIEFKGPIRNGKIQEYQAEVEFEFEIEKT